jgi:hypothetical protein
VFDVGYTTSERRTSARRKAMLAHVHELLEFLTSGARTGGSAPDSLCGFLLLVFPFPLGRSACDACQFVRSVESLENLGGVAQDPATRPDIAQLLCSR